AILIMADMFFFSSRRRHTRFSRDWSSDVCSSDLRIVSVLAIAVVAMAVALVRSAPVSAVAADPYEFKNVQIAGGGFVPGIIFSQAEKDLIYARTDIGGAYRWIPETQSWKPLLDWVGWDKWGWNGVVSIAPDPVDPDRVYAAVGMYTNSWDPNNGAILRSTDRG